MTLRSQHCLVTSASFISVACSRTVVPLSPRGLFFARPGFGHGLVCDEPKVSILPIRPRSDVVDDNLYPLQVGRSHRRTKQLGIVIQRVEDFDGPHASPSKETGLTSKKILAAFYVKVGGVGTGNGLGRCGDRKEKCKAAKAGRSLVIWCPAVC